MTHASERALILAPQGRDAQVASAMLAEAGIDDGFWGLLARGTSLGELDDRMRPSPISPGMMVAEGLVGPT